MHANISRLSARRLFIAAAPIFLAACSQGGSGLDPLPAPQSPSPQTQASAISGQTIGNGNVRVGLLLPLGAAGNTAVIAKSMLNAAELAIAEHGGDSIRILVKDDKGTAEGAREAARLAMSEGAELVIGPLLAQAVNGAGEVARPAGRPLIGFSTDTSVAKRGLYLMSFLPESDVDRIIGYAVAQGKRSFAAVIPESAYGNVVAAAFQQALVRHSARLVTLERYLPGAKLNDAMKKIADSGTQIDALFLPDNGDGLPEVARALAGSKVDAKRIQLLGTGQWNDPRVFRIPQLSGGWFSAPDNTGFGGFAQRYRGKYGSDPARIATLSYDAVALASALAKSRGSERYSEKVLTDPSGFAGHDGVFRFQANGLNERALGVYKIGNGQSTQLDAPSKSFGARS